MERAWQEILRRYGQPVTLRRGEEETALRALLQPIRDRSGEQETPTPLGLAPGERFLYLGPGEHPLDRETLVRWQGEELRVQTARRMGAEVCPHWWAVLYPRDEVEP